MNKQLHNTLNQQDSYSNVYAMERERNRERLKEFILKTPREFYDWYSNESDNFISFFFHNKEKNDITFNGVTRQELAALYKECGEFLGQNLYDMYKPNGYFR